MPYVALVSRLASYAIGLEDQVLGSGLKGQVLGLKKNC